MAEPSPPPPVEAVLDSSAPLSGPEEPNPVVEQEQHQKLAITTNPPTETPPPQHQNLAITTNPATETPPPQHQQKLKQPDFINYVTDLSNLSPALSAFHRCYNELHEHLDFIRTSIDSRLLQLLDTEAVVSNVNESGKSDKQTTDNDDNQLFQLFLDTEIVPAVDETKNTNDTESSLSEIESLCKNMCFSGFRKYILSNLSNLSKLREEVPLALKLASNPAKMVLECFGRFFLQGIKAYGKDSPMIPSRQASILALEYFLLMGFDSDEIETAVKQEAGSSAVDWRKRLISEGGLVKACEIEARGLLLLIGCFGIPKGFKNEDIKNLIWAGNAKNISDALRRSNVLLRRIPDVIEWMLKNKMEVEAVGIIYTFGLEGRFHPGNILKAFFQNSKEACKVTKKTSSGLLSTVNKANKSQLAEMQHVRKCLKDHKQDPSKVLHGFQLDEKISKLETRISDLDKKIKVQVKPKRKEAEEPVFYNARKDVKHVKRAHVDYIETNSLGKISNGNSVYPYGWRGLPNPLSVGVSYPSSASDLYQFADTIVETETYGGASAGIPSRIASAHPSGYYS